MWPTLLDSIMRPVVSGVTAVACGRRWRDVADCDGEPKPGCTGRVAERSASVSAAADNTPMLCVEEPVKTVLP